MILVDNLFNSLDSLFDDYCVSQYEADLIPSSYPDWLERELERLVEDNELNELGE